MKINLDKHIWEGWTVGAFIKELEPSVQMIMDGKASTEKFTSREEVKKWCMSNQPYYKKYIKEVVDYFCNKYEIK